MFNLFFCRYILPTNWKSPPTFWLFTSKFFSFVVSTTFPDPCCKFSCKSRSRLHLWYPIELTRRLHHFFTQFSVTVCPSVADGQVLLCRWIFVRFSKYESRYCNPMGLGPFKYQSNYHAKVDYELSIPRSHSKETCAFSHPHFLALFPELYLL